MTVSNQERADSAKKALEYYKKEQLKESGPISEESIIDLLVDLRHLLERRAGDDLPFDDLVRISEYHYTTEAAGRG